MADVSDVPVDPPRWQCADCGWTSEPHPYDGSTCESCGGRLFDIIPDELQATLDESERQREERRAEAALLVPKPCSCDTYTGSERVNGFKVCERCGGAL